MTEAQVQQLRDAVEFFFNPINLNLDKKLRKGMKKSDGWVDFSILIKHEEIGVLLKKEIDEGTGAAILRLKESIQSIGHLELNKLGTHVRIFKQGRNGKKFVMPRVESVEDSILYVKPVPQTTTIEDLLQIFDKFGLIAYIYISRGDTQRAFVQYTSAGYAQRALKGLQISEEEGSSTTTPQFELMLLSEYKKNQERKKSSTLVYFYNTGPEIKRKQIREALKEQYPTIKVRSIDVRTDAPFGFLEFKELSESKQVAKEGLKVNDHELILAVLDNSNSKGRKHNKKDETIEQRERKREGKLRKLELKKEKTVQKRAKKKLDNKLF
eukprot:TRINITY_DN8641_c0_g1_i1.p1 TRINITY_DN8641_c0_g1~~TRINITY_DN8641_c0_g1_i1.p1  ORF type:complete len:348 (-),score=70.59 TRINITY_DN8641_c0_g1_i1:332-1306(-)